MRYRHQRTILDDGRFHGGTNDTGVLQRSQVHEVGALSFSFSPSHLSPSLLTGLGLKPSALHHPNVVRFEGILVSPDHSSLYVVTELMERGSLHDILVKKGANIPLDLRFKMAIDAAQGMYVDIPPTPQDKIDQERILTGKGNALSDREFIHSKSIIHRDLKPHNLLVNATWETKVADFGISTLNPTMTRRMTCVGTPVYMAPEVLQLDAYSSRADVYSYAVVMSEIFTSSLAFSHEPYATMNSAQLAFHITEKAARPSLEGLHPTLQNLIEECWNANAYARPSFTEIVSRLKRLRQDISEPFSSREHELTSLVGMEDSPGSSRDSSRTRSRGSTQGSIQ